MKLTIIFEKSDDALFGRIEGIPDFLPVTEGKDIQEIELNLRDLLDDYITHEGQEFKAWKNLKADQIEFAHAYDLSAFFELFDDVKIGAIAKRADLNPSLVRHYVAGTKFPSASQAKKLENAIHELGNKLREVVLA